ncbi:MAG TPA: gas vesicle protein [Methanothrix sp.]|nr:gas vesicle protein [Methanothrix sp.]
MNPERESCLVEVLDRLLTKGAVLNADLIISVAGIPLIGVTLRAMIAGMETMLEYGIMEDWDKESRELYASQQTHLPLLLGEEVIYKTFGYLRDEEGMIKCWVPGVWNITSQRVILWVRTPGKVLFEAPLEGLRLLRVPSTHDVRKELELVYPEGSARISLTERDEFEQALREAATAATQAADGVAAARKEKEIIIVG